jgi:hypothetical protein
MDGGSIPPISTTVVTSRRPRNPASRRADPGAFMCFNSAAARDFFIETATVYLKG